MQTLLRILTGLAGVCLALTFGGLPTRANLITNGSFESPVVPSGSYLNFFPLSPPPGWTVVGPEVSIVSGTYSAGCCTFPAEDGNQWLDLTGPGTNSLEGIEQAVATTPGTQYTLSFWVGNVNDPFGVFGTTSTVLLSINGGPNQPFTNSVNSTTLSWQQFTTTFTASGSTTTIEFLNGDPITDNSNGLDNVVLNVSSQTPEPGTLSLLGIGMLGLLRRRFATLTPAS